MDSGWVPGASLGDGSQGNQDPSPGSLIDPSPPPIPPTADPDNNPGDYNVNNDSGGGVGQPGPDSNFNPAGGQDSANTLGFSSGGDSDPDSSLATSPPSALPAPGNETYTKWTWEQILDTVLELNVPDRSTILHGRWTGIENDSAVDPGLFLIIQIEDRSSYSNTNYTNIYLAPGFFEQSTQSASQSPWLTFEQGPGQILSGLAPAAYGLDIPGNSYLQLNPSGFAPAVQALMDAENYYLNAADTFSTVTSGLAQDAQNFQGQAGGEFAQLMQNFLQQATYAQSTMGLSSSLSPSNYLIDLPGVLAIPGPATQLSYSGLLDQAGRAASDFLTRVYNAWAAWTKNMAHSPAGAILRVLVNFNVYQAAPGSGPDSSLNFTVNPDMPPNAVPGLGDLREQGTWLTIEKMAKDYWQDVLWTSLDMPALGALTELVSGYNQATDHLMFAPPSPAQISFPYSGPNDNANSSTITIAFNSNGFNPYGNNPNDPYDNYNPNDPYGNNPYGNNPYGSYNPNDLYGNYNPNDPYGAGAFSSNGGLNGDNTFYASSGPDGGASGPGGSQDLLTSSGPNGSAGGLGDDNTFYASSGPGSAVNLGGSQDLLTSSGAAQSPVQQALDSNAGTQDALQSALTSGEVQPGSALGGTLNSAASDAGQTQAALEQAAGAGGATNSALQSALADNGATQAALNQALSSGQVQPGTPLASTLQSALNSANQTQAALNQALGTASPSSAQATATRTALGDNSQTQHDLSQALLSGQVPANSPLHSTIQSALTDAGKAQTAINQALQSGTGTTTASLDQALKDNEATQKALNAALASGQVPASGPLRNDLNQALADSDKTATALHQALAQQGIVAEPDQSALASPVGVAGITAGGPGTGGTSLVSATVPAGVHAQAGPLSSGAFAAPATTAGTAAQGSEFPMYSPMAGGGMMGGQGAGQGQGQERERSTWLAEDEDVWGTDPEVGPRVLGRDQAGDEEPEEYDGHPERPAGKRPIRRLPGR